MGIAPPMVLDVDVLALLFAIMLNMMAQGIACVILFWPLKFLEERKLKQLMLCMFVCFFFHHKIRTIFLFMRDPTIPRKHKKFPSNNRNQIRTKHNNNHTIYMLLR